MQSDVLGTIVWFLLFFVLIFLYPRLMLSQMLYKLEQSALKLEELSANSNKVVMKKIGNSSKETKEKIEDFTDLFVVEPSSIDPYGLVKKIDETIRHMEVRFDEFSSEIAPHLSKKEQQEVNYALRAAIGVRQISKIVRHYVETAKKFKNLQIAMILQMQLPIIEKLAESEFRGVEAFTKGWPIGDSIGPVVAASLMDRSREIAEDIVCGETTINGRKCFVLKAKGPAPHLGRIDEALAKIMKNNRIARVITIDAAQKLEGEKIGAVAEGVGFAMGGIGQREIIENMLLPKKMQIDSIIIKVGMTEAIMPMRKEIYDSIPKVRKFIDKAVARTRKGEKVIIIGVGNSCGVGDNKASLEETRKIVLELDKKYKEEEKNKKKGSWL
jgi:hypothetical protein